MISENFEPDTSNEYKTFIEQYKEQLEKLNIFFKFLKNLVGKGNTFMLIHTYSPLKHSARKLGNFALKLVVRECGLTTILVLFVYPFFESENYRVAL